MFEAAFPPRAPDLAPEGALRPLYWSEVVARLAATRDLRAVLARPLASGGGFAPQTASGIAGERERGVNLAALATGKCADSKTAIAVQPMGRGERDN
jgi:hypothetical protein